MKTLGIIPARMASTRFPGKPLALLGGKPVIQRVWENASGAVDEIWIATDSEQIATVAHGFGANCIMTSENCPGGTQRCAEAASKITTDADIIINIQGDEPFITPAHITLLKDCFNVPATQIATLAKRFNPADGFDALFSPDTPKVVMDDNGFALYFSRSIIPYVRDVEWQKWVHSATFFTHVGIYAFRRGIIEQICQLPPSPLEKAERLEQLTWLAAGYKIKVGVTDIPTLGIDTPSDLEAAKKFIDNTTL